MIEYAVNFFCLRVVVFLSKNLRKQTYARSQSSMLVQKSDDRLDFCFRYAVPTAIFAEEWLIKTDESCMKQYIQSPLFNSACEAIFTISFHIKILKF